MKTVTIDLPDDVFSSRRRAPDEFVREMRLAAAILWYARGEMSQEKAAQVADVSREAFLDEVAKNRIDVFAVDPADLQRELKRG